MPLHSISTYRTQIGKFESMSHEPLTPVPHRHTRALDMDVACSVAALKSSLSEVRPTRVAVRSTNHMNCRQQAVPWKKPAVLATLLLLASARPASALQAPYRYTQDSSRCGLAPFNMFHADERYEPPISSISVGRIIGAATLEMEDALKRDRQTQHPDMAGQLCVQATDIADMAGQVLDLQKRELQDQTRVFVECETAEKPCNFVLDGEPIDACEALEIMTDYAQECIKPSLALAQLAAARADMAQAQACHAYWTSHPEAPDRASSLQLHAQQWRKAQAALNDAQDNLHPQGIALAAVNADWRSASKAPRQVLVDPLHDDAPDDAYLRMQRRDF